MLLDAGCVDLPPIGRIQEIIIRSLISFIDCLAGAAVGALGQAANAVRKFL
jgi:hypothetical protein